MNLRRIARALKRKLRGGFREARNAPYLAQSLVNSSNFELVRVGGLPAVAIPRRFTTPWELTRDIANIVVRALAEADINHAAIHQPYDLKLSFAIHDSDWANLAAVLGRIDTPLYVFAAGTPRRGFLLTSPEGRNVFDLSPRVTIFPIVRDLSTSRLFGHDLGVNLERWIPAEDESLKSADPKQTSIRLPAGLSNSTRTRWDGGTERCAAGVPSRDPLVVDEPIDAVYLWVDGADPDWQSRRQAVLRKFDPESDAAKEGVSVHRFRDRGELRASLRSLESYAPWIRKIYLVTDQQRPAWLDETSDRITIVDHRDIFADLNNLPTYNSHAIGSQLHRIPGLADRYLIMNDDVIFTKPVTPSSFYSPGGAMRVSFSRTRLPHPSTPGLREVDLARLRTVSLLERDFGRRPSQVFAHVPVPQRKDIALELEQRYAEELRLTASHQFRSAEDLVVNSWLYLYYALLTGRAIPSTEPFGYINPADRKARARLEQPRDLNRYSWVCVNDVGVSENDDEVADWMESWVARCFPRPASFERLPSDQVTTLPVTLRVPEQVR